MKPLHDRWEVDPVRERRPLVRIGKTWRIDWDIIITRAVRRLVRKIKGGRQ
jgi:hypothetical protein